MTSSCQTGPGQLHWQHRGRDWRGSSILEIRHPHNIAIARRQLCVEAVVAGGRHAIVDAPPTKWRAHYARRPSTDRHRQRERDRQASTRANTQTLLNSHTEFNTRAERATTPNGKETPGQCTRRELNHSRST